MEVYVIALIAFATIGTTHAATALGPAQVRPTHPNMCYEAEDGQFYAPGQSWQISGCGMATCNWSNYTGSPQLMVAYESCGVVSTDPPCYITEDATLPYPECCPQITCPEDDIVPETETHLGRSDETSDEVEEGQDSPINSENSIEDKAVEPRYYEYYEPEVSQNQAPTGHIFPFKYYDDSENMIQSNELDIFENEDYWNNDYDFLSGGRKISPKFQQFGTRNPKHLYHWIY